MIHETETCLKAFYVIRLFCYACLFQPCISVHLADSWMDMEELLHFSLLSVTVHCIFQMTLQMLGSEQSEDLKSVKTHLDSLLPTNSRQVCVIFP